MLAYLCLSELLQLLNTTLSLNSKNIFVGLYLIWCLQLWGLVFIISNIPRRMILAMDGPFVLPDICKQISKYREKKCTWSDLNPLTSNDHYSARTAPLTSKVFILYIYATNTGTGFLNMIYTLRFVSAKCSFFHNSNVIGSCFIHILYTGVLKFKKIIPAPKVCSIIDPGHEYIVTIRQLKRSHTT